MPRVISNAYKASDIKEALIKLEICEGNFTITPDRMSSSHPSCVHMVNNKFRR